MSPEISIDLIPQDVLEDIRVGLQAYFVPLLVHSPRERQHPADLAGSGTLVALGPRHYILTADHVWQGTQGWSEIGLVLAPEGGAPLALPRDGIHAKRLAGREYSEWGPDLALVEIPPQVVGTIGARKSFLNLARRRAMLDTHPPQMEKALWAVVGLVGQSSKVSLDSKAEVAFADLQAKAFFAGTCRLDERGGYDYLTTSGRTTLPDVPASFKGVSGGGLWQIALTVKKATGAFSWTPHFCGVAFWEEPNQPDCVEIRCHGPRSVFERAWAEWGLGDG